MQEINVEQIMSEIRDDVEKRKIEEPSVRFSDISAVRELELPKSISKDIVDKEILHLNAIWDTTPAFEIRTNNKVKYLIKKIVSKIVLLSISENVKAQNLFNYSVVNVVNQMHCLMEENEKMKEELQRLRKEILEIKQERL